VGVEPTRLAAQDPKSCLSANSSTPPKSGRFTSSQLLYHCDEYGSSLISTLVTYLQGYIMQYAGTDIYVRQSANRTARWWHGWWETR
jgi:hypothetical protein